MANGFQVADIIGQFRQGQQFAQQQEAAQQQFAQREQIAKQQQQQFSQQNQQFQQQQKLVPLELQSAKLGVQQQQQTVDARTDDQKNQSLFNTALSVDSASDDQIIPILEASIARAKKLGGDAKESIGALELARTGDFAGVRKGAKNLIEIGVRQGDIEAPTTNFTLSQGQRRFSATGKEIASVAPKAKKGIAQTQIPTVLLEGLSPELASKASAAYTASGGGKDGIASFQKVVDKGSEQERRLTSPKLIQSSFPKASPAETVQLQAAMDAARTTETGLKAAGKIRDEQRRLIKVQGFQDRSIALLDKILDSDELGDVLGSIEGTIDFRLQDSEAELISDIQEVGDILTADNLKLMSGVLSESDIKILRNLAGGGLKRTRTEERFRSDVQGIRDEMSAKRVSTVDEQTAAEQSKIAPQYSQGGVFAVNPQTGQRIQLVNGQWVGVK